MSCPPRKYIMSIDTFAESLNIWLSGNIKVIDAAKMCGISYPTYKKYAQQFYDTGELPDWLWKENEGVEDESQIRRLSLVKRV